jgi:hypothetical protein
MTDLVSKNATCHVTPAMAQALQPDSIFSVDNIVQAIRAMRPHTAAGRDGLSIDFYKLHADALAPHLQELFLQATEQGRMSDNMRHAVISLLLKGKGLSREDAKSYRPISVTATEYRILGRCMHQRLAPMMRHLLGESQVGFVPGRLIDESILALTELAHFCETGGRGGIFVMLDNAKADDRVQWPFLQQMLEAYHFPRSFRSLVAMLFADISSSVKVNGHTGRPFPVHNGVRQGCCIAPLLYLLVHEGFLRFIRADDQLRGISISDAEGHLANAASGDRPTGGAEMRERAFADDTGVGARV